MVTSWPPAAIALISRPRREIKRLANAARLFAAGLQRPAPRPRTRRVSASLGAREERGGGEAAYE